MSDHGTPIAEADHGDEQYVTSWIHTSICEVADYHTRPLVPPGMRGECDDFLSRISGRLGHHRGLAGVLRELRDHDRDTFEHSVNVMRIGGCLIQAARREGLAECDDDYAVDVGVALLAHDIGKLAVPAAVLNKRGALDAEDMRVIRAHPDAGLAILGRLGLGGSLADVIGDHHERADGSGYPRGLRADEIRPWVSIAAIADVYDAVCAARPYREAMGVQASRALIARGAGNQFCPRFVALFLRTFDHHEVLGEA